MAILFTCPTCGATLRMADAAAGRVVRCGTCQGTCRVPDAPAHAEPAEDLPESEPESESEPRPRRAPRSRPRRASLAWVFWLVGGIVFLVLSGAAVAVYVLIQPSWRSYESEAGGFRVDLPGSPRPLSEMPGGQGQADVSGVGALLLLRREEYIASYLHIPPHRRTLSDSQLLTDGVNGAVAGVPGARKVSDEPIEVGEFPGREVVIEAPGKGTGVLRVVIAGDRAFCLIAAGPSVGQGSERARRFLDSFTITDPRLLAVPEQRREAARREAKLRADILAQAARQTERDKAEREAAAAREVALREAGETFRLATHPARSVAAPDELGGLRLYLPFDTIDPGEATPVRGSTDVARLDRLTRWAATGPGVRGSAVYLPAITSERSRGPALPPEALPEELRTGGPLTVATWVRVRSATVEVFRVDRVNLGARAFRLGLNDKRVWAEVDTAQAPQNRVADEPHAGRLSAPWGGGEDWHHLAVTVEPWGDRQRVKLYLDGLRVAVADFDPAPREASPVAGVAVGRAVSFSPGAGPSSPSPERGDGLFRGEGAEAPVVGLDELCVFARPLAPAEVRRLAGAEGGPADDDEPWVRFAAGKKLPPLRDVVFDTTRGKVWIITAHGDWWVDKGSRGEVPGREVHRYSYPGFEPEGRWALNGNAGGAGIALDPAANRLCIPVDRSRKPQTELLWQRPAAVVGELYRLDVDELPAVEPDEPPHPVGAHKKLTSGESLGLAVSAPRVSADGKWLYFLDCYRGGALCRVSSDLSGKPERLSLGAPPPMAARVYPTADGKRVRIPVMEPNTQAPRLVEVDLDEWAVKREVRLPAGGGMMACHPDGRVFRIDSETIGTLAVEIDPSANTRRIREGGFNHYSAFLDLSPDGRLLFVADVGRSGSRVVALDAAAGAAVGPNVPVELGRLADPKGALQVGGPFWVSPDGQFLIFRSGQVVRIESSPRR
jgi:hypothetical protein